MILDAFAQARAAIALYFRNNGHLKDPRVVDALVMKGYMDLEETTMQVRSFRLNTGFQSSLVVEVRYARKLTCHDIRVAW